MISTSRAYFSLSATALLLACLAAATPAQAASISYPNVGSPPGFTYSSITESSGTDGVPLYGAPLPPLGLAIVFAPTPNFKATSIGGGADLTDGQLNFTMNAGSVPGGVPFINVLESGTYTLGGVGPGTVASAGLIVRATVLEINGAPVSPFNLIPGAASFTFSLPANLGTGSWSLFAPINVTSQLSTLGYGPGQFATKVEVVINNALVAASTPTSNAQIIKGQFGVNILPEPSSLLMMGLAVCGLGLRRSAGKRN